MNTTQTTFKSEMERANALEQAGHEADAEQVRRMAYADFTENGKPKKQTPLTALRHHVTGSIERGESTAIVEVPAKSEYDTQAENFLTSHGLKFRATLSNSKTAPWTLDDAPRNHFRITISRKHHHAKLQRLRDELELKGGRGVDLAEEIDRMSAEPSRLTFDFFGSIADAEKGIVTVKPYDVLACISGDAFIPETFSEYCDEYGVDPDSLKALQQFRRCDRFAKRLRAFFTPDELTALSEIQ